MNEKKVSRNGCRQILINSSFVKNKNFIKKIIKIYGNQFVVIGVDLRHNNSNYSCYFNRGKNKINTTFKKHFFEINKLSPGEI